MATDVKKKVSQKIITWDLVLKALSRRTQRWKLITNRINGLRDKSFSIFKFSNQCNDVIRFPTCIHALSPIGETHTPHKLAWHATRISIFSQEKKSSDAHLARPALHGACSFMWPKARPHGLASPASRMLARPINRSRIDQIRSAAMCAWLARPRRQFVIICFWNVPRTPS
jgi:hypothetical protein